MKTPGKKSSAPTGRRLSPKDWIEAEELYRNGWTQAQLADKYGIRPETISRHMTKKSVKGGANAENLREELAAALAAKQRAFAEQKAQRQIDAKETMYKMVNLHVAAHAKEFQAAMASGRGLAALSASAKTLKDSMLALKVAREEMYSLLDIEDGNTGDELPDLKVSSMTAEEEELLRARVAPDEDDEELEDLADSMASVVENIDHQVEISEMSEKAK